MSTLGVLLDVRPEERRNTFAAFGTLVAVTTGHTLLETARDALFLSKLPASQLPWMYLVIVVFALGLAQIGKLGVRADSKGGVAGALVVAAGVTACFWGLARDGATAPPVLYALYVWTGLFASWVTVQFWTLLGRAHTITQARRLYGFIGAGAVLGAVLGALLARAAIATYSPRATLLFAAALFVVAAVPCTAFRVPEATAERPAAGAAARDERRRSSMSAGFAILWQNAFARRVLGIVLVATVTVTLADFLFKSKIAAEHGADVKALGAYLSTFYAVTNAFALVAQLVVAPWIFRTMGVQRALFFFPALILAAAAGILASGGALLAAVAMKGLDGVLRYSLHRTSTELLLVPVPDGTRERVKPIIDLVGSRGGQALASIGILAIVAAGVGQGATGTLTVGAIVMTLAVVWLALVFTIRRLYLDVFRDTLKSGGLSGKAELPELDLGALETLFAGLNSSYDNEVLASLELLAEQKRERLIPALILYHPSRDVVVRALELFAERGRTDFVSIADRLNGHPDREVATAALRARTAAAPDRKLLRRRLLDDCPQVSATALIELVARGWIDRKDAEARFDAALSARSWQTALELARAIRDVALANVADAQTNARFDALLIRLAREASSLRDVACATEEREDPKEPPPVVPGALIEPKPESRVRLEVARAMAARKSPAFLPVLTGMLSRHELRSTARAAMLEIPGALEFLDGVMQNTELARTVRVHVPRTMALFEPEAAARLLLPHLVTERDGAVRYKVLRALVRLRRASPGLRLERDVLVRSIDATIDHAVELRRWRAALSSDDDAPPTSVVSADPLRAAHHLLVDLVRDKEVHATARLFLLLELLYGDDFEEIGRGVRSSNAKRRASSLELIENLVRPPLRARVLGLVGESARPKALDLDYEGAIREILARGGRTMRTLAEYRAVELGIDAASVAGADSSHEVAMENIGKRLIERARDMLTVEPVAERARRAPA